jgi:hypothetical protein
VPVLANPLAMAMAMTMALALALAQPGTCDLVKYI